MRKPFDDGFDIICAGIKREDDEFIKRIYFFNVPNGINQKYESLSDYKASLVEASVSSNETAEQIMEDIEDMFAGML